MDLSYAVKVRADVLLPHLVVEHDRGGDAEERGRGNIPRHSVKSDPVPRPKPRVVERAHSRTLAHQPHATISSRFDG